MEEARYEIASLRQFARLSLLEAIPDETTMLHFRHLLERQGSAAKMLSAMNAELSRRGLLLWHGTMVDATVIHAPSSTNNSTGTRDPEMHQVKKGNQWFFELKAHIGADDESVWRISWRQRRPTSYCERCGAPWASRVLRAGWPDPE